MFEWFKARKRAKQIARARELAAKCRRIDEVQRAREQADRDSLVMWGIRRTNETR